jgi:hypothetical protein
MTSLSFDNHRHGRQAATAALVVMALLACDAAFSASADAAPKLGRSTSSAVGEPSAVAKASTGGTLTDVLAHNPGAQRLDATSVLLEPGVIMTVPGPVKPNTTLTVPAQDGGTTVMKAAASTDCPYEYLCMWVHTQRQGARLTLYFCGDAELKNYYWGNRGQYSYRDNVSSIWNNQSPPGGIVSYFYDFNSLGGTILVGTLRSGNYLLDLTLDRALYGGTWNDRIDKVRVC